MPKESRRPDRVAAAIREEIANFLAGGVKDPRVAGLVTVTGVDVTRDLRHAKVFVSVYGSDAERASTLEGLASVSSHLRGQIGRALRLQFAPELSFRLDESIARAARIETLLSQLNTGGATAAPLASEAAEGDTAGGAPAPDGDDDRD